VVVKVRFRQDGPLVFDVPEGTPFTVNGERKKLERSKLALCRCGQSQQKPLCDGTHKETGFKAEAGMLEVKLEQVFHFVNGER
jgi:CDGSH iron-sulfur domain-containing protein 3